MAIAGSPAVPSAGFIIRNRRLVQMSGTTNKPASVIVTADDAATRLLFDPLTPVQLDTRRGTAEKVLRLRLVELGVIDA